MLNCQVLSLKSCNVVMSFVFLKQTAEALGCEVVVTLESFSKDFVTDYMLCIEWLSDQSGSLSSFLGSSKLTLFLSSCSQLILFCSMKHLK